MRVGEHVDRGGEEYVPLAEEGAPRLAEPLALHAPQDEVAGRAVEAAQVGAGEVSEACLQNSIRLWRSSPVRRALVIAARSDR